MATPSGKCHLLFVRLLFSNLPIACSQVQGSEVSRPTEWVQCLIYPWKRLCILMSNNIEFPIINAKPPGTISLFHYQHKGLPWASTGSQDSVFQHLFNFFVNSLFQGHRHSMKWLPDRESCGLVVCFTTWFWAPGVPTVDLNTQKANPAAYFFSR